MKIILASGSPRRRELLSGIDPDMLILSPDIDESFEENDPPQDIVMKISAMKAEKALKTIKEKAIETNGRDILVSADTIVYCGSILGKPKDKDDSYRMLRLLSGKKHSVYTGFTAVRLYDGISRTEYEKTDVFFKELSDEEIYCYIQTGEPLDKAGAYGAQGFGGFFIDRIEGCFFNVVGLPLAKLSRVFIEMGYGTFLC